ncbi:MAG: hypothetical protein JWR26_2809 [Pedosphaera sp.]|nr:hypothetical protein [Pedosphaera sp.]
MKPDDILSALQDLTQRESVEFLPLAPEAQPLSPYPPIVKYLLDLKNGSKPETAAEDLFTALCKDLLGFQPTRQVGVTEGFVDFMLPEPMGQPLPLELKPLFQRDGADALWRSDANPKNHVAQVKKYLRDHEYLVLTDLRTAWFFGARDFYFEGKPFAELPFADFLTRCRETRSVLDAVRRVEDTAEKPELEQQFFADLKIWFGEFDKVKWTPPDLAAESIILLINKLIFARTIEDFGLVPYRFTQDTYTRQTKHWEAKGPHRIVPKFLAEFEDFFDDYYDTEIFSSRVWDRLDKDPANLKRFCEKLNFVLGVNSWDQTFSRGIVHYNYRRIDEDIFGKSYEMFLASNRKDEGIYYTPAGITGPMANSLVESLSGAITNQICEAVGSQKCDFARADKLMAELAEFRVADTACGSGGFLIKVLRAFWGQYQRIDSACAWVNKIIKPDNGELYLAEMPPNVEQALAFRRRHCFDNNRILIARVLLWHIFGVDKDPGAIEVAKTNIWKEAVKLSPADYNYRLLKTDVVKILPNLELNFLAADSLVDVELEKQAAWLAEYHQTELKKLSELRQRYIDNPMDHGPLDEALELRRKLRIGFVENFQTEKLPCEPAGFALHFWPCWFGLNGKETKTPGFDGIIGNPPWETVKPVRKEFAQHHCPDKLIGKNATPGQEFETWFKKRLEDEPVLKKRWQEYEAWYEDYKVYLGLRFQHQGTGDWNYFKLFLERNLALVRHGGNLSMLVPSSFQTDEGCMPLRRLFMTDHTLDELTSFENRGYIVVENGKEKRKQIFPDVHPQFKFGYLKITKSVPTPSGHSFNARFYLHDPAEVYQPPLSYPLELVRFFSPQTLSFVEYRSEHDMLLFKKLRGQHPFFGDLKLRFRRELHSTGDARFIQSRKGAKLAVGQMPMIEGRNIHQFDAEFTAAEEMVIEKEVREELLRKQIFRLARLVREQAPAKLEGKSVPEEKEKLDEFLRAIFVKKKFKLDYELPRLAYREIASSTNERTLIATLVPAGSTMNHKLMYLVPVRYELTPAGKLIQEEIPHDQILALLGILNSLVANYYIRSRVSSTVSAFYVYELPLPKFSATQKEKLSDFAAKLLKDPRAVEERAALEVFIARELYGLSLEDWKHLTGTFTFGGGDSKAELDEIIRQSIALWK